MKAGLDVEQVVEALGGERPRAGSSANRSGRMLDNDYPLGFKVALHRKDLAIALELAAQLGAALPVSALAAQLESGSSPGATPRTTCPRSRARSAACPASTTDPAGSERGRQSRPTSSIGSPSLPS